MNTKDLRLFSEQRNLSVLIGPARRRVHPAGPEYNCLCGRQAPFFACAPNQEGARSKKAGSYCAQDQRLRRRLGMIQARIDAGQRR